MTVNNKGLKWKPLRIKGKPCDFNTQQDVAEMLQVNLDKAKSVSLAVSL